MTHDQHQTLRQLSAQYRAVRAPVSLTRNTLAAAAQQPVRRRWPLALASASLLAIAALVILRQGPTPPATRSAALPTLATLGGRLAIIKPPSLGRSPSGGLPALPPMPAVPATPPSMHGAPARPIQDEVNLRRGVRPFARSATHQPALPAHLVLPDRLLRRIPA